MIPATTSTLAQVLAIAGPAATSQHSAQTSEKIQLVWAACQLHKLARAAGAVNGQPDPTACSLSLAFGTLLARTVLTTTHHNEETRRKFQVCSW